MRFAAVLVVAVVCSGTFASEPGQPLDCSDWVSDLPGYTCEELNAPNSYQTRGSDLAIDNQGFRLYLSYVPGGFLALTRQDPVTGETPNVGHIVLSRPGGSANTADEIRATLACPSETMSSFLCGNILKNANVVSFDPVNGTLSIPVVSSCVGNGCDPGHNQPYPQESHTLRIRGFATLLEIFQSYVPQTASIGFTVPWMPEGMAGAEHFDTYTGPLTKPLDFTQAQPLACDYPATAPAVGDHLTVADPLSDPAPGTGRYYVTSATYQGATRYGRKATGGVLSGRDPALLPACTP